MIIFPFRSMKLLAVSLSASLVACGPTPAQQNVVENARDLRSVMPAAEKWLKTEAKPDDWHRFAMGANWDFVPISTFRWIVEQPECDRATALLIFWLASPTFFVEHRDRAKLTRDERELFDLVVAVRTRFMRSGYRRSELEFRLEEDVGILDFAIMDRKLGSVGRVTIPLEMRVNLPGRRLDLNGTSDGIPRGLFEEAPPWENTK
jgi:Domain of unknown function (DUF4274)